MGSVMPTDASHLPTSLHLSQKPRLHETWLRGPGRCGAVRCTYLRTSIADVVGNTRELKNSQSPLSIQPACIQNCIGRRGMRRPKVV